VLIASTPELTVTGNANMFLLNCQQISMSVPHRRCRPAGHETRRTVIASVSEAISSRSRLLRPRLPRRLRLLAMTRPSFVLVKATQKRDGLDFVCRRSSAPAWGDFIVATFLALSSGCSNATRASPYATLCRKTSLVSGSAAVIIATPSRAHARMRVAAPLPVST
jgi:hypothetical protein